MNPVRLGALLDDTTRKMGLAVKLRQGLAVGCWEKVVGSEISAQTEAGPVRNKVMFVKTPNPVLAHQLRLMEREILQRYRQILGGQYLRGLRVQIGQIKAPTGEAEARNRVAVGITAEREKELAALAAAIPHPGLAASFLRAARAWAERTAAPPVRPDSYVEMMLGDTWPTAAEVQASFSRIDPDAREQTRARVINALMLKIAKRVRADAGNPRHVLAVRGDLRRLALAMGYPASGLPKDLLDRLLGGETGLYYPDRD